MKLVSSDYLGLWVTKLFDGTKEQLMNQTEMSLLGESALWSRQPAFPYGHWVGHLHCLRRHHDLGVWCSQPAIWGKDIWGKHTAGFLYTSGERISYAKKSFTPFAVGSRTESSRRSMGEKAKRKWPRRHGDQHPQWRLGSKGWGFALLLLLSVWGVGTYLKIHNTALFKKQYT